MPTTTNYGWTTPADTDLVKDGASAIRTLGTAIDTTVFNNAGAAIAKTIVDAKGDIIAATAADTVSILAVGANDTVLTADSSTATGLKWAAPASGGMTLLSTTNLSGTTTTISNISQSYTNLFIVVQNPYLNSADALVMKPNGAQAGHNLLIESGGVSTGTSNIMNASANLATSSLPTYVNYVAQINNYTDTTYGKTYSFFGASAGGTSAVARLGNIQTASAITSLDVTTSGGTSTFSGGRVLIYGVK